MNENNNIPIELLGHITNVEHNVHSSIVRDLRNYVILGRFAIQLLHIVCSDFWSKLQ